MCVDTWVWTCCTADAFSVWVCLYCMCICFSYQHRGPGHPYRELPAEGPAAPCPCSLWSHHGRMSLSMACACWLWKRWSRWRNSKNVIVFLWNFVVVLFTSVHKICLDLRWVTWEYWEWQRRSKETSIFLNIGIMLHHVFVINVLGFYSWQED